MRSTQLFQAVFVTLIGLWCHTTAAIAETVTGVVREQTGANDPIGGARVTLFNNALSLFRETRTTTNGAYSFGNVPDGSYQLGATKLAYEYVEDAIPVSAGLVTRDFALGPEAHPGQWDVIGTTAPEFFDASDLGVLMPSGEIFYCHNTINPVLFNPTTGSRSFPSGSPSAQGCQHVSLLPDGEIIMMGGQSPADPGAFTNAIPWVKSWTPTSQTWQLLADMQHAVGRWYPGLARLADGSFLLIGGGTCCAAVRTDTCERFDLTTQTWSYTGSVANPSEFSPSALLYTGEVLTTWWPPQLYNPDTEQWRLTGNLNQPNRVWPGHCDHSLVVLEDGRALAIGVVSGPDNNTVMGEIYDPVADSWSLTSNPDLVRFQTEVVQLPDGRILVAGGETEVDPPPVQDILGIVKWSDIYDPATDSWRRVADMNWNREYHAVTLLVPDGRVVTTGGTRIKFQIGPLSADIEAFSPPYLFRGVRPEITGISATDLPRGGQVTLEISPQTQLTSVVLIGTQTTTHWVDGGIPRRLVLPVQQDGSTATATLPTDPNVALLGYYMLFAMVDDIPSEARIVRVIEAQGVPTGACCNPSGSCTVDTEANCAAAGDIYLGDNALCGPGGTCPVAVPTVSNWAAAILASLLLSSGILVFGKRRADS
jgi:Galactose oxidase-like, Early set domain/Carboxypeptidase regulatory-like domain/Galactose oxidase, central domain